MADKMTCPVCDSRTSSVLAAVRDGEPCPYCATPADVILRVSELRASNADAVLVEETAAMTIRLAKAEGEVARLEAIVRAVREAVR